MFVRYQIAPVGKKYGWAQGASDCWYYSAKSLLRFYGLAKKGDKGDHIHAYLQTAKLLRLFINGMRAIYGKDLHHPMLSTENLKKWIDEEIRKIESTRQSIVEIAEPEASIHKSIKDLLASENLWSTENILKLSSVCKQLDGILGGMDMSSISAKRYTFLKISQTICKYETKWKDKTWTISEIFNSAFPPSLFQAVMLEDKSAEGLCKALQEHGPLWTTGSLHARNPETYTITTHLPEGDVSETRNLVENYISGSSHAVAVYGVNTDSKMVEYADPHDFTTPRRVQAAIFFDHLRSFEFNSKSINFLKVKCDASEAVLKQRQVTAW
jgi:hypothetical protein